MFDHVGLRVRNLQKSARLYEKMLKPLGWRPGPRADAYAGFGPRGKSPLWLHKDKRGGGAHLAIKAGSRAAVRAFHKAGLKAGAKDNGAPGVREDYAPNYYAAFLLDADGNNIEAVCMA